MNHSTKRLALKTGLAIVLNAAKAAEDGNDVSKSLAVVVNRTREVATISPDDYSKLYLLAAITKHEYEKNGVDRGRLVAANLSQLIAGAQNALIDLGERI